MVNLKKILTTPLALNILKKIYDEEVIKKKGYSMELKKLQKEYPFKKIISQIFLLKTNKLLFIEKNGKNTRVSITEKGKRFIDIFDKLIVLSKSKTNSKKNKKFRIEYNLSEQEKKILIILYKLKKETEIKFIKINDLKQKLPKNFKKLNLLKKIIELKKMHLIEEVNKKIQISETGERIVKTQFLENLI